MKMSVDFSCVGLNDLPDEILMIIFRKLNNLDVLYSLIGVNERLNQIAQDPIFTNHLTFVRWSSNNYLNLFRCDMIRDRFCLQILPEIHTKIKRLDLEISSMKHVLHAADYPNLDGLGLYNIDEETAKCLFTDDALASGIFKNQITKFTITINQNADVASAMENIWSHIFTVFISLTHLIFYELSYNNYSVLSYCNYTVLDLALPSFSSSTLLVLKIKIKWFDDCLYLLDGRFNQLHTLYVDLVRIRRVEEIENQRELPNLKCFSLSCAYETDYYDELILPLLYRMTNLEKLGLYFSACVREAFISGNNLKKNIINRVPRLKQFTFHIHSIMFIHSETYLPSKEDLQRTFIDFPKNEIIFYVDFFLEAKQSQCHIYSYPFLMQYYGRISNNFSGGLFPYVREVSLYDEHPFEHEFFLRIVQSFPYMEILLVTNEKSQKRKQSYESNNGNRNASVIVYTHLTQLTIATVHDDYMEQFLFDTKTYFGNNVRLNTDYKSLQRVTHNFTRDATRINCTKITELCLRGKLKYSNSLQDYFSCAKIVLLK